MSTPFHIGKQKCPHCPVSLAFGKLNEHIARCVLDKPEMCELCGKRFTTPMGVRTHKGRFHTGEERGTKFNCRYCEHGTNDQKALEKHMAIHPECGGPGFRSRSRSRSRAPADTFNTSSSDTVGGPSTTPSYAPSIKSRSRSRSRVASTIPVASSGQNNGIREYNINWANHHPTHPTHNQTPPEQETVTVKSESSNGWHNSMFDYSLQLMKEDQEEMRAKLQRCQEQNRRLRDTCVQNAIALREHDPIEQKIQDAFKIVDSMMDMDDEEEEE